MTGLKLLLSNRLRRTILTVALAFAVLFSLLAIVQYLYVKGLFDDEERARLSLTLSDAVSVAVHAGKWQPAQLRQANDFGPANYVIVSAAGQLIDSGGDSIADVFDRVGPPMELGNRNVRITNQIGEPWIIIGHRVDGGRVYEGSSITLNPTIDARDLERDMPVYGSTIRTATYVRSKDINAADSFLVLDDFLNIKTLVGGMPINVVMRVPSSIADGELSTIVTSAGSREMLATSITTASPHARIYAFDDVSSQSTVISSFTRFDVFVAFASWLLFIGAALILLVRQERSIRKNEISLQRALEEGENEQIEFKEGVIDNILAQTITAFSNSSAGGNIFIGVADDGTVLGIAEHTLQERDKLQQKIRNIAAQRIKPSGVLVRCAFLPYGDKLVCRISVSRGAEAFYMFNGTVYLRHMTSVVSAEPTQIMSLVKSARAAGF